MKILSSYINKQKQIPQNLCDNIFKLKRKMETESTVISKENFTTTTQVRSLNISGIATFKDGQYLAKRNKKNKLIPYGKNTAMIEFDKTRVIVDDQGNILEHKKPFWKDWENILLRTQDFIQTALYNYDNERIVKKQCKESMELTPKGKEIFQKAGNYLINIFNSSNQNSLK